MMFRKVKTHMISAAIGITATILSSNAFSAGPVTYLAYLPQSSLLLVTAGGTSCSLMEPTVSAARIAATAAQLAAAKENGKNVSMHCGAGGITFLSL